MLKDLISKNWQILLFECSITYLFEESDIIMELYSH